MNKKKWKYLTICYINYIIKNKQPISQLYLSINDVYGYISEETGEKILINFLTI